MPGTFDDLIPTQARSSGAFDDLVPKQEYVDINPNSPNLPQPVNRNTYDPNADTYFFRPRYSSPVMQLPGDQLPLVRNPKDITEGLYNSAIKGVSSVASPLGAGLSALGVNPVTRPLVTAGLGYLGVKGVADAAGTLAGTQDPTAGQVAENVSDAAQGALMLLPAAHAVSEGKYAYDTANGLTPQRPPISTSRPYNDIVLDAGQPVKTLVGEQAINEPTGQGDQTGATAPASGVFDDLVPKQETAVPANPGGAEADLPADKAAISKANNQAMAEAWAKQLGVTKPIETASETPVPAEKVGEENVPVQESQEEVPQEVDSGPKGNIMSEEAAGLRHDLLPLVDEPTRKVIAKYYTDTGDLDGALEQVKSARGQQVVEGTGKDAKLVFKGPAPEDRPVYPLTSREGQLTDAKGRPVDKDHNFIKGPVENGDRTIGSGIRAALDKNQGAESGFINLSPVKDFYDKLVGSIASRGSKREILRDKDAADNAAVLVSNEEGNGLRSMAKGLFGGGASTTPGGKNIRFTHNSDLALEATTAAVEANGDRNKLQQFIAQAVAGKDAHAKAVAEFAYINWDRLKPLVDRVNTVHEIQYNREVAAGFNLDKREGYIQHLMDPEKLGLGQDILGGGQGGGARGFTKMRYNDTLFEHVEKGNSDAIKTWNAADLVEHRLRAGLSGVNDAAWVEGMRHMVDPTSGQSLVKNMEKQVNPTTKTEHLVAPAGYEAWSPFPGRTFAVHKGYKGFLDSITSMSFLRNAEIAGLPVGDWLMQTKGALKHSMLLFDTFHAVRMTVKGAGFGVGGRMARALLEYNDHDLGQAVANKEITQKMADFAVKNRNDFNTLVRAGLNVGRVAENMDASFWQKLPIAGSFNKWVFEKLTRSIMAESALSELKKQTAANPGMSRRQVAAKVAKDINLYFGNIGRQGIFHSKSMQDLTQLAFLAPQWAESMAQTELRFAGQTAKIPFTGKVGTIARGTGTLMAAFLALTQIGNLVSKGQPTWKNPDGHKLDMWIPGEGKGFWFSPLSMPMELTHDAVRYSRKGMNPLEVGAQIVENKLSPMARAEEAIRVGRDFSGAKLSGVARLTTGLKNLIPLPLPAQSAINPNASTQRQLMASAGIKAEPVEATKAELASGDTPLESRTLAGRKLLERQLKANKPAQSLSDRRLMLERSAQAEASRNEEIHDGLPKEQQKFVDSHGLQLPTYEDTLQMGSTRLSLTKKEQDFVRDRVIAEYSRVVDGLMSNPTFEQKTRVQQQNRLNDLATMARGRVRVQLRRQMAEQRMLLSGSQTP